MEFGLGEKIHEQMIGMEDARYTYEYSNVFKILPAIHNLSESPELIKNGLRVPDNFIYDSGTNTEWMTTIQLQTWLKDNRHMYETK